MTSSTAKQNCLIILSVAIEGVSAQSFIEAFTLTHSSFNVQLASPSGRASEFINQDDNSRRWLNDFRTKAYSNPIPLETVDVNRYSAVLIPSSPGAMNDLAVNRDLGKILQHFVQENKVICAIGIGVAGLFSCYHDNQPWLFNKYSMTSTSVYELVGSPYFRSMAIVPEDFIKKYGAKFNCSEPHRVHVIVDRNLVTGQNDSSSVIAVQNCILLCNNKQKSTSAHGVPHS